MHILLVHQAFAALGEPGGTRHHEFARKLTELGHRVTVITGQVNYLTGEKTETGAWFAREVDDSGVEIWRCRSYSGWHKSFFHRLLSFFSFMITSFIAGLRVRKVTLVWGTSPPIFQAVTAWMLARLKGAPFLFEVRDLWPYFAIEVGVLRQPIIIRLSEWLERFLYKRADSLVINSPGFMEHVSSRGGECVFVVPNGVDVAMFDQTADSGGFRSEHHLQDKFVLLYAGAHGVSNDLGTILDAAEILKDAPSIRFVLLGDGKEKPALQEKARKLSLSNVLFLPPVPKKDMPGTLAGADACVAILKPIEAYTTTYPNKVFDYMAAGKPVLLMIDGVIREVVEDADAGIFIEPGDAEGLAVAVQELEADPALGDRLGGAGKRCVEERFDRTYLVGEMERVMMTLVESESAESSQQDGDRELG